MELKRRDSLLAVLLLLFCLTGPLLGQGTSYTYKNIADTDSEFNGFFSFVVLNDSGRVGFRASLDDQRFLRGVFTSDGGSPTTVMPPNPDFDIPILGSINNSGFVAFLNESLGLRVTNIDVGDGGMLETIHTSVPGFGVLGPPAINDAGTVAFPAITNSDDVELGIEIVSITDGVVRTIARNSEDIVQTTYTMGGINEKGFVSYVLREPRSVRIGDGSVETVIASEGNGLFPLGTVGSPALNDHGDVAFAGVFGETFADAEQRVVSGRGGALTPIAGTSGPYRDFLGPVSINNNGVVAFYAILDAGGAGIFTGADPAASKVIATGDELFGSSLREIYLFADSTEFLNNADQVAFGYLLSSGLSGIAIATPVRNPPALSDNSVVDGASFVPFGEPGHAPAIGSIVSVFGGDFANRLTLAVTSPLTTSLDGIEVSFEGIAAPVFFTSSGQINAQIPFSIEPGMRSVRVTNRSGASETRQVSIAATSPSIFTFDASGTGQGIVVFANTATLAAPLGATSDSQPARSGDVLTVFANGLGAVEPPISSGRNSCDPDGSCDADFGNLVLRHAVVGPTVEIGGVPVPPENIVFAGLAPEFVGLNQINFIMPDGVPTGNAIRILIRQGDAVSQDDVTMAVR